MSKKLFGTDGIRGVANQKLTPELAYSIGLAAGRWIHEQGLAPRVVIGRDTRKSGSMLGAALASGLCSAGVDVVALGVAPTGGISYITRTGDFSLGVVISASHNPAPDNGIKLIAHNGRKVSDGDEARIEQLMDEPYEARPTGAAIGAILSDRSELERYLDYLVQIVPEGLQGMKLVVDGAHGAAYELGPEVFRRLGAEVIEIGVRPDGMNINAEGGATKPEVVQALTAEHQADLGIAFDGDADRAVFSDDRGRLINGDRTIAIWCGHWHDQMATKAAVGTVMSNGGFEKYLGSQGIRLERVNVGDKYVSAKLDEIAGSIGGEQSGHIIFPERGPTGDGLITALELLRVLRLSGKKASSSFEAFENWPQLLVNVQVERMSGLQGSEEIRGAIQRAEGMVEGKGRINVRPSGTQPMIRVMVEADDVGLRDQASDLVVKTILEQLGGEEYSRVDLTHALGD